MFANNQLPSQELEGPWKKAAKVQFTHQTRAGIAVLQPFPRAVAVTVRLLRPYTSRPGAVALNDTGAPSLPLNLAHHSGDNHCLHRGNRAGRHRPAGRTFSFSDGAASDLIIRGP